MLMTRIILALLLGAICGLMLGPAFSLLGLVIFFDDPDDYDNPI